MYDEGDTVVKTILARATMYSTNPADPPAVALRTNEEIWEREVTCYVNAMEDINKDLK